MARARIPEKIKPFIINELPIFVDSAFSVSSRELVHSNHSSALHEAGGAADGFGFALEGREDVFCCALRWAYASPIIRGSYRKFCPRN